MIKIVINDIDWEIIKGQQEASYIFPESLEIPKSRINDLEYISISLAEEVEYDGKGECEIFVKSVDYEVADFEDKEPDTRVCDTCMKDIDIDNESHFESTFDNYLCFECGDKVLSFKFEEDDYSYIDYNVFTEYDESCNYGYEECWKLEEKEND